MNATGARPVWKLLIGIGVSLAAVLLLGLLVDWQAMLDAWGQAQVWVVVPAAACAVLSMFLRSCGWWTLMGKQPSLRRSFWNMQIGYLLNILLPFRLGDVARGVLISRGEIPVRISAAEALSSVALERALDMVFMFLMMLMLAPLIAGEEWGMRGLLISALSAAAGVLIVLCLVWQQTRIVQSLSRAADSIRILRPAVGFLDTFLHGLRQIREGRRILEAVFWFSACWIAWWLEYWVLLIGFHTGASASLALMALVGGMLGVVVPSSPASIGVYEAAVTMVLSLAGLPGGTAAAYAVAIHLLNILLLSMLGVAGLAAEGQSIGSVLRTARHAQTQATG